MSFKPVSSAFALSLALAAGALAAPSTADRSPAKAATPTPVRSANVAEIPDEPTNCSKARKRLWVENEGWVVRKVTTCR